MGVSRVNIPSSGGGGMESTAVEVTPERRAEWRRLYGHDSVVTALLDYIDALERRP